MFGIDPFLPSKENATLLSIESGHDNIPLAAPPARPHRENWKY
jgi:hypothetical protein